MIVALGILNKKNDRGPRDSKKGMIGALGILKKGMVWYGLAV